MPNYANAVIYKITHDAHPSECYIGSTTQKLERRMSSHRRRASSKPQPVHKFLNDAGWDNAHITAVEEFPCEHKDELLSRERFWITKLGTLNKNVPGRTMTEYNKYYYTTHKVAVDEKCRAYYQANREAICEYRRNQRALRACA